MPTSACPDGADDADHDAGDGAAGELQHAFAERAAEFAGGGEQGAGVKWASRKMKKTKKVTSSSCSNPCAKMVTAVSATLRAGSRTWRSKPFSSLATVDQTMPVVGDRGADQRQAREQLRRVRRQAVLDQRPYCLGEHVETACQAAGQQAHRYAEQHDEGQRHGQRRQRVPAAQRGEQSRVEWPGGDDDDDGEQQRADEGQQHRDAADDQQRDDGKLGECEWRGCMRRDLRPSRAP